ncbi:MAG: UDP-N-acetylmuramoyl-tripeptide--D-alanyl-D-alanine ligase [Candidatus Omnitrophica bacterium]|nr:UDP-N-acetylmuramoyl-tripeptide--D-alanyl-D-alanine ligase [Candidatus Omnitrophota bacterium]
MFRLKDVLRATKARLINKSGSDLFTGVSTDSRAIKKGDIFFALKGENFDGHNFVKDAADKKAAAVIISDDKNSVVRVLIKSKKPAVNILKVKDTAIALGNLAKYYRRVNNVPLIAVTGSVGKTTAKDIIAQVLSKRHEVLSNIGTHNNHIGVPQTIFRLNEKHNICVLELGTSRFGEISYLSGITRPDVAVITNIGASHLEFFKNLEGVFKEKKTIVGKLKGPRVVLLNGDDVFLRNLKLPSGFKVFYFGQKEPCDFMASDIAVENNAVVFSFNKKHKFRVNTLGKFNIYNVLAGIACGLIFGLSIEDIKESLNNFKFPDKRLNKINCPRFSIIDDTYNSNPLSLRNAIESLIEIKAGGRKILVMGDMLELGKESVDLHRQIGSFVAEKPIDIFVTFGKLSKSAAQAAKAKSGNKQGIFIFDSKPELINFLKDKIQPGDAVLIKGSRRLRMEEIVSSLKDLK